MTTTAHRSSGRRLLAGAGLAGWLVGLAAIWWWLAGAGGGPLAPPPVDPRGWADWTGRREPVEMLAALARVGARAMVAYLAGLTLIGAFARVIGTGSTAAIDRCSPRPLVRLLDASGRFGLSITLGAMAATAPGIDAGPSPAVTVAADDATVADSITNRPATTDPTGGPGAETSFTSARTVTDPASVDPTAAADNTPPATTDGDGPSARAHSPRVDHRPLVMTPLVPRAAPPPTAETDPAPRPPIAPDDTVTAITGADTVNADRNWVVRPGEHFWSIAVEVVTDEVGDEPSPELVERYWGRLVEANRATLSDPSNPDLLFAGQHLVLPHPVVHSLGDATGE